MNHKIFKNFFVTLIFFFLDLFSLLNEKYSIEYKLNNPEDEINFSRHSAEASLNNYIVKDCSSCQAVSKRTITNEACAKRCYVDLNKCNAQNKDNIKEVSNCWKNIFPYKDICSCGEKILAQKNKESEALERGWIVANTINWIDVNFKQALEDPLVFAGLPIELSFPGIVKIKNVSNRGFYIKILPLLCSNDRKDKFYSATVSWIALNKGEYVISPNTKLVAKLYAVEANKTVEIPRDHVKKYLITQLQENEATAENFAQVAVLKKSKTISLNVITNDKSHNNFIAVMTFIKYSKDKCEKNCNLNGVEVDIIKNKEVLNETTIRFSFERNLNYTYYTFVEPFYMTNNFTLFYATQKEISSLRNDWKIAYGELTCSKKKMELLDLFILYVKSESLPFMDLKKSEGIDVCQHVISNAEKSYESCRKICLEKVKHCESFSNKLKCLSSSISHYRCSLNYLPDLSVKPTKKKDQSCTIMKVNKKLISDKLPLLCICPLEYVPCTITDFTMMDLSDFNEMKNDFCASNFSEKAVFLRESAAIQICSFDFKNLNESSVKKYSVSVNDETDCLNYNFTFCKKLKQKRQMVFDCVLSEWGEWEECSVSCFEGGEKPKRKRRRYVLLNPSTAISDCGNLEEERACADLPKCSDCFYSEWSEWSACTLETNDFGEVSSVNERHRYIWKYNVACHSLNLIEIKNCTYDNKPNSDFFSDDDNPKIEKKDDIKNSSVNCDLYSQHSGCSLPCMPTNSTLEGKKYSFGININKNITCFKEDLCDPLPPCPKEEINESDPTSLPQCFISNTRKADNAWSQILGGNMKMTPSCICADMDAVPCTAYEALISYPKWNRFFSDECKTHDINKIKGDVSKLPGDSQQFVILADGWRVHCPINKLNATFTQLKDKDKIDSFCENGMPIWSNLFINKNKEISFKNCMSKNVSCTTTCNEVLPYCVDEDGFYKEKCNIKNCGNDTCTISIKEFYSKCSRNYDNLPYGNGLVLCKFLPIDCEYSDWGEWGPCSNTCLNIHSVSKESRIRERKRIRAAQYGGKSCDANASIGHYQIEECSWLPLCTNNGSSTYTSRPMPIVLPFNYTKDVTTSSTEIPISNFVKPEKMEKNDCEIVVISSNRKNSASLNSNTDRCTCPSNRKLCSVGYALRDAKKWDVKVNEFCKKHIMKNIFFSSGYYFSCTSMTFTKRTNEQILDNVFCYNIDFAAYCHSSSEDGNEETYKFIGPVLSLIIGIIFGFILVCYFILHSTEIQNILGLQSIQLESKKANLEKTKSVDNDIKNNSLTSSEKTQKIAHSSSLRERVISKSQSFQCLSASHKYLQKDIITHDSCEKINGVDETETENYENYLPGEYKDTENAYKFKEPDKNE